MAQRVDLSRLGAAGASIAPLSIKHPNAAGIDIGGTSHYVAVPLDRVSGGLQAVREFGPHTENLNAIADWLIACRIDTVALESTGVYWIALYELLESRGIDVWLVDAKSVRHVKARKSDVLDCQWLQQLHSFGLLCKAHRPDAAICALREMSRLRDVTIEERARHIQRMQKALTQMNIQLTNVITDITGETGLKIIRAIVAGERDRMVLAAMRNYRVHASVETIAMALEGRWSREHLFSLAHELKAYDFASEQIARLDSEIETLLGSMKVIDQVPEVRPNKGRRKNTPAFEGRRALLNACGVDLTEVPGIDVATALTIFSEVGSDLSRFETAKRFCSWLGLCPGTRISGNKRLSGASKRIPNRISRALKRAAMGLSRSRCAMGAYYRKLCLRMGSPKAITAVAHKLARIVYAMLSGQAAYVKEDQSMHDKRYQERAIKSLQQRAKEYGMTLTACTVSTTDAMPPTQQPVVITN
jgi:transposase